MQICCVRGDEIAGYQRTYSDGGLLIKLTVMNTSTGVTKSTEISIYCNELDYTKGSDLIMQVFSGFRGNSDCVNDGLMRVARLPTW